MSWDDIKHKFVGGPYAGAGAMPLCGDSVGVEAFEDDAEAIKAILLKVAQVIPSSRLVPSKARHTGTETTLAAGPQLYSWLENRCLASPEAPRSI